MVLAIQLRIEPKMPFQSARVRLTIWYTVIMIIITAVFSLIIYIIQMEEVKQSVRTVRYIIGRDYGMVPRPEAVVIIDEDALRMAKQNIIYKLFSTNLGVLLITAGAAYFLAGRTLRPIEHSIEIQKHFISDASHEIRTPLTAMRTTLEVSLLNKEIVGESREALEDSLQEVLHLQCLSDSLLNLSQLESSHMVQRIPLSLRMILDETVRLVSAQAEKKHIQIQLPEKDLLLLGNQTRLTELFVILLDNAVKYSPDGSEVFVSWVKQKSHIIVSVVDHGIGIPAEDITHVFDRFYRSDKSRTARTGGYGLGLAIAKRIVELHNGTISVNSREGKGTAFHVSLPAA